MAEHTPTPWMYEQDEFYNYEIFKPHDGAIASVYDTTDDIPARPSEGEANAEFIVRAVNAHDELLAACEALKASTDTLLAWLVWLPEELIKEHGEIAFSMALSSASDDIHKANSAITCARGEEIPCA